MKGLVVTIIAASNWESFADRFNRSHDGWMASLRIRRNGDDFEMPLEDRPFHGLTFRPADGSKELVLAFGEPPEERIEHSLGAPADVAVLGDDRDDCAVVIGLRDGGGCLLELTNPRNPDRR